MLGLHLHRRARFAEEAFEGDAALSRLGPEELERDGVPEREVTRGKNDAHSPSADELEHLVPAGNTVAHARATGGNCRAAPHETVVL